MVGDFITVSQKESIELTCKVHGQQNIIFIFFANTTAPIFLFFFGCPQSPKPVFGYPLHQGQRDEWQPPLPEFVGGHCARAQLSTGARQGFASV